MTTINDMYLVLSVADLRRMLKKATELAKATAAASSVPVTDYNQRIARHCVVIENVKVVPCNSGFQISSTTVTDLRNMIG